MVYVDKCSPTLYRPRHPPHHWHVSHIFKAKQA